MMIPRYYEDLSILHDNTMPMRSYYIPASQKMNTLIEHREDSDRFQLLNGVWKFQYYKSVYDLKEAFYRTSLMLFNTALMQKILMTLLFPESGRLPDMIHPSTPTSATLFHLIRLISRRIFPVEPTSENLLTMKISMRQKFI